MIFVAPVGLAVRGIHKREKDPTKRWPDTRDKNRDLIKCAVWCCVCVTFGPSKQPTSFCTKKDRTMPHGH
jgi:hypothetical protein